MYDRAFTEEFAAANPIILGHHSLDFKNFDYWPSGTTLFGANMSTNKSLKEWWNKTKKTRVSLFN